MKRRHFLTAAAAGAAGTVPALLFAAEKSNLKITSVRLVHTRPKRPLPSYQPSATAWSTNGVEVASPMSMYPEYKATRSLFLPDPGKLPGFTVEIATDKAGNGY